MEVMMEGLFLQTRGFSRSTIGGVKGHMHQGSGGGKITGQKWRKRKAQWVSYLLGEYFERLYRVAHCIGFKKRERKKVQVLGLLLFMFSLSPLPRQQVCACAFAYVPVHA